MVYSDFAPLSLALTLGPFEPAIVQRQYQWREEHVAALASDLISAFRQFGNDPGPTAIAEEGTVAAAKGDGEAAAKPLPVEPVAVRKSRRRVPKTMRADRYVLGAMIFYRAAAGGKILYVYDGLQRLTTLTLLLAELRDGWPQIPDDDAKFIRNLLFEGERQRLTFTNLGRTLNPVVRGDGLRDWPDKADSEVAVHTAVGIFKNAFTDWPSPRRKAFLDFLAGKVYLTVTEVDNLAVANQMFNGANDRGLRLGASDVLKGLFAEQIRLGGGTMDDVAEFATLWRGAQLSLRRGFDPFIHALEVLKFRPERRHVTGEHLRELFEDGTPATDILAFFRGEFSSFAVATKRARQHFELETSTGVDIAFRQLSFLGWNEWLALYLQIAITYDGDYTKASFADEVRELLRACIKTVLFDEHADSRYKKFLAGIEAREEGRSPFASKEPLYYGGPAGEALKRRLRGPLPSQEQRGTLVRWVETLHWGTELPRWATNRASAEHVLPVTARGTSPWLQLFTNPERDEHTHRLGNLCLLGKADNEAASNHPWAKKKDVYERRDPETKGPGLVLKESAKAVARGDKEWSVALINELTERLAVLAGKSLGL